MLLKSEIMTLKLSSCITIMSHLEQSELLTHSLTLLHLRLSKGSTNNDENGFIDFSLCSMWWYWLNYDNNFDPQIYYPGKLNRCSPHMSNNRTIENTIMGLSFSFPMVLGGFTKPYSGFCSCSLQIHSSDLLLSLV